MGAAALYAAIAELNPVRLYAPPGVTDSGWTDTGSDGVDLSHVNSPTVGATGPRSGMLAVDYNAAADAVSTAASPFTHQNAQSFVIVFRSASASNPGSVQWLMANATDANNRSVIDVETSGAILAVHKVGGVTTSWQTSTDYHDNAWHLASFSFDNGDPVALGYVDGVQNGSQGTTDRGAGTSGNFNIGATNPVGTSSYAGAIALVAAFNSTFDATTHADLYAEYRSVTGWRGWRGW